MNDRKCGICGKTFPEQILKTVRCLYAVDGQTIMESVKSVCPLCEMIFTQELFNTSMFPAKGLGEMYDPIPHHDRDGHHCPDCNAAEGEYHEEGCDWETCPVCGGQLLSCGHRDIVLTGQGKNE